MPALSAVGVHIFAGGFSLGVENHFRVRAHLEAGPFGVGTWRLNRPEVSVFVDKKREWADAVAAMRVGGPVDLVYGNPPCTGFSLLNVKGRGPWSKMNQGVEDVVRMGMALDAKVVVVESVRQALTTGQAFFHGLWERALPRWHGQAWFLVNAYDHGVPQWRPRLFWVLSEHLWEPLFRPQAYTPTLLEALEHIPPGAPNHEPLEDVLKDPVHSLFSAVGPGKSIADVPREALRAVSPKLARWVTEHKLHLHWPTRLRADRPARVVYSTVKYIHPVEDRLLTARELARLMGFPDAFLLEGPKRDWAALLGKGICPPVGTWLAGEVAAYLEGDRPPLGHGLHVAKCYMTDRVGDIHARRGPEPLQGFLFAPEA